MDKLNRVMIFPKKIRDKGMEDNISQRGGVFGFYVVAPGYNAPVDVPSEGLVIDGALVKSIDSVTEEERNNLIVISEAFRYNQTNDVIYELLRRHGFKNVAYGQRSLRSLSIKERFYYTKEYGWNLNTAVPVRSMNSINLKTMPLDLKIYVVTSHFDLHKAKKPLRAPAHSEYIQAGAALTDKKMCELRDNVGEDNISLKNPFYCEFTALYWLHKNKPMHDYIGFNLYSRVFLLNDEQLRNVLFNGIDAIVSELEFFWFRGCSFYDIKNYVEEALFRVSPQYVKTFKIVKEKYINAPCSLLIAKRDIFYDYCEWLFSVLDAYEEILRENAITVPRRHFGYTGERLLTTYFLHNSADLNILFQRRLNLF